MLPLLLTKMVAAAAPPPSGYSHYYDEKTAQVPNKLPKVRGDDLLRLANARALFPPLAHFACPSCPLLEISLALFFAAVVFFSCSVTFLPSLPGGVGGASCSCECGDLRCALGCSGSGAGVGGGL